MKVAQKNKNYLETSTLTLYVSTWSKDSYGLYDYQSQTLQQRFQLYGGCKIFRNLLNYKTKLVTIQQAKNGLLPSPDYALIASIKFSQNNCLKLSKPIDFVKYDANEIQKLNDIYVSIRTNQKSQNYEIRQRDIIKFGRLIYSVMQINNGHQLSQQNNMAIKFLSQNQVYHQGQVQGCCKICLSDQCSDQNFLVSPCNCKGSCQMVHILCLQQWIDSKVKKQIEEIVLTYNFTKFNCQICKISFPKVIVYKNKHYSMVKIEKPKKPYIILQSLGNNSENLIHIMTPKQATPLTIGRSHQSQLRLTDISVSRNHAEIQFFKGKYYLRDLKSKFGTLIKLRDQIQLNQQTMLQAGRCLYTFKNENLKHPKSMAFLKY